MNRRGNDRFSGFHPAVIFVYLASVLTFSMIFLSPLCLAVTALGAISYGMVQYSPKAVGRTVLWLFLMTAASALISGAFQHRGSTVLFFLKNGNAVTRESILYGFASGVMVASVLGWFACGNASLPGEKWIWLFGRVLPSLALLLSMILRLIPAFIRQAGEISDARKGLGVSGKRGPFSKLRDGGHVFSVLVSRSLENAVVTADSMKSRGYGLPGRTAFSRYRFTGADGALLSFILALTAFVGWCGVKKAFSYSFYPTAGALTLSPLGWIGLGAYLVLCLLPTAITIREEWKWKHIRSEI